MRRTHLCAPEPVAFFLLNVAGKYSRSRGLRAARQLASLLGALMLECLYLSCQGGGLPVPGGGFAGHLAPRVGLGGVRASVRQRLLLALGGDAVCSSVVLFDTCTFTWAPAWGGYSCFPARPVGGAQGSKVAATGDALRLRGPAAIAPWITVRSCLVWAFTWILCGTLEVWCYH